MPSGLLYGFTHRTISSFKERKRCLNLFFSLLSVFFYKVHHSGDGAGC